MKTRFHRASQPARARLRDSSGQSLMEFALTLPLMLLVVLGIVELGFGLFDKHVITRLTREGANMISRNTTLEDARNVLVTMSTRPVNFDDGTSKLILSVLRRGNTAGTANNNQLFLYQRHVYGTAAGTSAVQMAGSGSFGGPPDYQAANADNNPGLRLVNPPAGLAGVPGSMIYVAEIYTTHTAITPLGNFGVTVPTRLYAISYF
jgi:Flp pilus assembly protein TadG